MADRFALVVTMQAFVAGRPGRIEDALEDEALGGNDGGHGGCRWLRQGRPDVGRSMTFPRRGVCPDVYSHGRPDRLRCSMEASAGRRRSADSATRITHAPRTARLAAVGEHFC
jgi:hypothetical protein